MRLFFCLALTLFSGCLRAETTVPEAVSFNTEDGGVIHADYYSSDDIAVVLAHGAVFDKASWHKLAIQLVKNNIGALAIDFRGYGQSEGGSKPNDHYEDILAAVRYLHQKGIKQVAVLGASMGGGIAGNAAKQAQPGELSGLILLSPTAISNPEKMKAGKFLYIASENEGGVATIKAQYQQAPEPKQLKLLKGNSHAQRIFKTAESDTLTETIIQFLTYMRQIKID